MKHCLEMRLKQPHMESSWANRKSLLKFLKEITFGAISGSAIAIAFSEYRHLISDIIDSSNFSTISSLKKWKMSGKTNVQGTSGSHTAQQPNSAHSLTRRNIKCPDPMWACWEGHTVQPVQQVETQTAQFVYRVEERQRGTQLLS